MESGHHRKGAVRIAIYVHPEITLFHLSIPQMVFDEVRRRGLAEWMTVLFSDRPGSVVTAEGYLLPHVLGPEGIVDADLVVVPSWHDDQRPTGDALVDALRAAHTRGASLAGLCLGAIPLADTGLLDGRSAVTHWKAFDSLAQRHPSVRLDPSVLYIDHGDILTSAGTASGLDACLHIIRDHLGAEAGNVVARSLVVAPHRDGSQAQYIDTPMSTRDATDPIADVLEWMASHLTDDLSIDALARRAHVSRRTFIRSFRGATGTTPAAWVSLRRLDAARRMLETTTHSVELIAHECGFGSAVTFRQRFAERYSATPTSYRRDYGGSSAL